MVRPDSRIILIFLLFRFRLLLIRLSALHAILFCSFGGHLAFSHVFQGFRWSFCSPRCFHGIFHGRLSDVCSVLHPPFSGVHPADRPPPSKPSHCSSINCAISLLQPAHRLPLQLHLAQLLLRFSGFLESKANRWMPCSSQCANTGKPRLLFVLIDSPLSTTQKFRNYRLMLHHSKSATFTSFYLSLFQSSA